MKSTMRKCDLLELLGGEGTICLTELPEYRYVEKVKERIQIEREQAAERKVITHMLPALLHPCSSTHHIVTDVVLNVIAACYT